MVVLDTNVFVYLLFDNYENKLSQEVLKKADQWKVPKLLLTEFSNVIISHFRHKLVTEKEGLLLFRAIETITQKRTVHLNKRAVLKVAFESNLSYYDSEFITLAIQNDSKLVTSDKKIINSFPKIAQSPKQFLGIT